MPTIPFSRISPLGESVFEASGGLAAISPVFIQSALPTG